MASGVDFTKNNKKKVLSKNHDEILRSRKSATCKQSELIRTLEKECRKMGLKYGEDYHERKEKDDPSGYIKFLKRLIHTNHAVRNNKEHFLEYMESRNGQ